MGANNSVPAVYDAPAYTLLVLDLVLTTTAVLGRIMSRRIMKAAPAMDDYLAYVAYVANIGLLTSGLILTSSGALDLGKVALYDSRDKRFMKNHKVFESLAVLYVFSITLIKLSILFFYRKTFTMSTPWFRYVWWSVFTLISLWMATCFILLAFQSANKLPVGGFARLGVSVTGVVNAFSDFVVLGLPAFIIARMNLQRKQKLAVISIFLLGGVASIVSIVRGTMFFIHRDHRLNKAYSNYLDIVLTATEASAGLMCACLPLTKPVVIRMARWIQGVRGTEKEHHGWTTLSASGSKSVPSGFELYTMDRTVIGLDDCRTHHWPATSMTEKKDAVGVEAVTVTKPNVGLHDPQRVWGCDAHRSQPNWNGNRT